MSTLLTKIVSMFNALSMNNRSEILEGSLMENMIEDAEEEWMDMELNEHVQEDMVEDTTDVDRGNID